MAATGKWIEGIGPDTPVDEAARRSLEPRLSAVAHCLSHAAHLAEHDIEHVHRLRVATRRAAAAVKLYRDWLPRKPHRWFKKRLRRIRRAASQARDLDVLMARLRQDSILNAEPLLKFLSEKRAAVQPDIAKLADRLHHDHRFVRKTARLLDGIESACSCDGAHHAIVLGEWTPPQLAKIAADFFDAAPRETDDIEAVHQFRIQAKALRYAIELVAPVFGSALRDKIYPVVEELQERLGKVTDHTAAMELITEWRSHEKVAPLPASPDDWLELERRKQQDDLREFRQWWTPDRAQSLRESLATRSLRTG
jgi:CHAD domain-containing protein